MSVVGIIIIRVPRLSVTWCLPARGGRLVSHPRSTREKNPRRGPGDAAGTSVSPDGGQEQEQEPAKISSGMDVR
ncbi:hypothetical protein GN956_G11654 [Arapaima gigas]